MRLTVKYIFILLLFLSLSGLACDFSYSSANISDAYMSLDDAGQQSSTVFAPADTFYLQVDLVNAPDDTTVKASWTAVSVAGEEPNLFLDETELVGGDGALTFHMTNSNLWPAGQYKVDIYLNDNLDRSIEFTVQ